ncbi:FMN-binding glutamate synthase family protein [Bacilli bacterium]|uniref:FMN-binding glutamate synthase family protein n=1 Tax=Oceanobacillus TaxID=182709 RepID=UPI000621647C|nr:glutamate synthase [Bacilli bacterium VT-13-104]PZD89536.1 FMN-binding glutamate synthase family protein [Bacilli bacterium]PZD91058.1 FMN-binding glutamate synthase family protein [Bacilli bacterium]PZD92605.1 FMN-binding glutamate synthase family protein [Bacilli bacterium]RCO07556.1 FMN-binding glutamate synthase family protein [Bacilli bacterium]
MPDFLIYIIFAMILIIFLSFIFILFGWRWIMKKITKSVAKIVLSDNYQENIIEIMPGLRHTGIQNMIENSLRSESGDILHRPLGSSKKWPHLDSITFIPTQILPPLIDGEDEVDMAVTIGPKSKKPMKIQIPLMISGMAYGIALSEQVRLALAQAAKNTGTAINSGEGGVMQEELDTAGKYILQFGKSEWSKETKKIKRADMIEVKFGQGALFGVGSRISPENLTGNARQVMGLEEEEDAVIFDNFFENQTLKDLKELVDELRKMTGGVPIGAKIGASGKIEEDIDYLLEIGVDYIAVDGGQAATLGAPPILTDDMGIPSLHAIVRAVNHLKKRNKRNQVSLIVSGGMQIPGHFLKMLALGADAIYIGSAMLFAVAHGQLLNALPFEPPTQAVWNEGKFKDQFKAEEGAKTAESFLTSSIEEMKMALRAMGKRSLNELTKKDLVSYDEHVAKMVGIPYSFKAWEEEQQQIEKG